MSYEFNANKQLEFLNKNTYNTNLHIDRAHGNRKHFISLNCLVFINSVFSVPLQLKSSFLHYSTNHGSQNIYFPATVLFNLYVRVK